MMEALLYNKLRHSSLVVLIPASDSTFSKTRNFKYYVS